MDRQRILRVAGAILAIGGIILLYPAVMLGVAFGLNVLFFAIFAVWITVLSGLSLRFGINVKYYVAAILSGAGIVVLVGLIFLTSFPLELKLALFNVFLVIFIFAGWLLHKKKKYH